MVQRPAGPPIGDESTNSQQFVDWLRDVAPYIHAFRGKTFVIGFPGELIAEDRLNNLVQDVSLLNAMGMKIVVVHGSRPQVVEQLSLRNANEQYEGSLRITDSTALECVKEAAGEIRLDIEAAFSQGLPNTPMQHSAVRVVSGNLVTARPVGIVNGTDYLHSGLVRKVDTNTIVFALQSNSIVLLSPLGFSPTGEAFNLTMEDVAASAAVALDADKLIFLTEFDGIADKENSLLSEISESLAHEILDAGYLEPDAAVYLQHALRACRSGVSRAHLVPFRTDGSLLLECFRHDGVGTMLVEENLDALREATLDDVAGILTIIRPMEEDGTLVPRDHSIIERDIESFSVVEHDGVIFGCAALYVIDGSDIGEMACVAVNPNTQSQGDGGRLLRRIEQRARAAGLKRLFVQTTRTMHWFIKRGFQRVDVSVLPSLRREKYNWDRRSQILIKHL
ncbi:MAG: amino-acid N-acetyltransferase [Burkholderiaceae bacterium]